MKILITNHHLRNWAGSEIFTRDLATELKSRGHDVFVYAFVLGNMAEEIRKQNIPVSENLVDFKDEKFDLIHAQHNTTAVVARSVFPQVPMTFMSHGILPDLEQPPSVELGIYKFLAVSEEVQQNLVLSYGIINAKTEIVRNFVDTERFAPKREASDKPGKLLVLSNHYTDEVRGIIETACKDLGIDARHIGLPDNPVSNVEDYMDESDIVVTLGKGALESMATERNVIVFDMHGGDGFVDEENFFKLRRKNFSGRTMRKKYSVEEFKSEILKYDKDLGKKLRKIVSSENSRKMIVDQLEKIFQEALIHGVPADEIGKKAAFPPESEISVVREKLNHLVQRKEKIDRKNLEMEELGKTILQNEQEIEKLNLAVEGKNQTIASMESSKFWKLRAAYLGFRSSVRPLRKFFVKYPPLAMYLARRFFVSLKEENPRIAFERTRNYLLTGKGTAGETTVKRSTVEPEPPSVAAAKREDYYQNWIETVEKPRKREEYRNIEGKIEALEHKPKISVLMPVYNTDEIFLRKAIFSVINQHYPNWELCIVDDCSSNKTIRRILGDFQKKDSRIKVHFSPENGGISEATNEAAEMAGGEFLVFLDHDDELESEALFELAKALNTDKEIDFAYSDDDKISPEGTRYDPQFKPDWSPELLLSYCYVSHLKAIRRTLFHELGGFKSEFDGSQDYDFVLRLSKKTGKIFHIPKILYHWRSLPGSTAQSAAEKPESVEKGRLAHQEALRRRGIDGRSVAPAFARKNDLGIFKINFNPESYQEKVTIIIPTKDKVGILKKCIQSIRQKTTYPNYEILVINNGSVEKKTTEYLKKEKIRYINIPTKRFNFALINNLAVEKTDSDLILFMNNDIEVISADWMAEMVGAMNLDEKIGAVGARLVYPDKRIQHAGVVLGLNGLPAGHANKLIHFEDPGYLWYNLVMRNYSAVTAACLLTRKSCFREVGAFDDKNLAVAYNDVDFCLKLLEAGYRVVYNPHALLYHHEGHSRGTGSNDNPKELEFIRRKWKRQIANDKYYNPNLSLKNELFEIFENKRILLVSHNLYLEGATWSLFYLAKGLKAKGYNVNVVAPGDGPLKNYYEKEEIKVDILNYFENDAGLNLSRKFDVFFVNTILGYKLIEKMNEVERKKTIWCIRESEKDVYFKKYPDIKKEYFAEAGRVVFVSDETKSVYAELEKNNFTVIKNGLDLKIVDDFLERSSKKDLRKKYGFSEDDILINITGAVCPRKGQMEFTQAAVSVLKELENEANLKFLIIGAGRGGDYEAAVKKEIQESGFADNILVIEETPNVFDWYLMSDIFVCNSYIESFPRVILEAMAFSLSIISTDVYGIKEQIRNEEDGLLISAGDSKELAEKMRFLLTNKERGLEMGKNARKRIESEFTYGKMLNQYVNLIEELCAE